MNAKEFLEQASILDRQIETKLQRLKSLEDLATRTTTILTDMPKDHGSHGRADVLAMLADSELEVDRLIDKLVDVKKHIMCVLDKVEDERIRTVLERRYLHGETWSTIALAVGRQKRTLYRIHSDGLEKVQKLLENVTLCHDMTS